MSLKKTHKRLLAKPSKRNAVVFNYTLDTWRIDRIARNLIIKERPEVKAALTFYELKRELSAIKSLKYANLNLRIKNDKLKVFIDGKQKKISDLERKLFKVELKKKDKSLDYQIWVVAKYLT